KTTYSMRILWRGNCWVLDLYNSSGEPLILGVPLVSGTNLLEQHQHLQLGFALAVACDNPQQEYPTQDDLGSASHLYIVTEQ
ncbi:phage baseplate plug family protein, partial [Pantoea ananatis]